MSPKSRGILFAQLNALCAGLAFATGDQVVDVISGIRFSALMYLVAAPANTIWWALSHARLMPRVHADDSGQVSDLRDKRHWGWLLTHTAFSTAGIALLWTGMARAASSMGALLSRLEVVVAVFLGLWWLQERFNRRQWWGFALTLIGVVFIRLKHTELEFEANGFTLLILSAVAFGLAEVSGKVAVKYVPVPRLVLIRAWLMAASLVVLWLLFSPGWTPLTPKLWILLVLSAVLGPVLSRNNYMLALSYLPVSQVTVLNQTQPIYTAIAAYLMMNEQLGWHAYLGGVAILLGNIVLIIARGPRNKMRKALA